MGAKLEITFHLKMDEVETKVGEIRETRNSDASRLPDHILAVRFSGSRSPTPPQPLGSEGCRAVG